MKKRRNHHGRNVVLILLAAVAVICGSAAVYLKTRPEKSGGDTDLKNGQSIAEIAKELSLDTELVKVSCLGSVAKIDIVTPGLDTCSMPVALYDLKNNELLSQTELSEGAWITGQTEKGFYAVEQSKKTLYIYDKKGNKKTEKSFSDAGEWSPVCAVSEDEKYFIYADSKSGTVYYIDLGTDEKKTLSEGVYLRESLGFHGGIMYAVGMENEIYALDIADKSLRTEISDKRLNTFSPFYSLGTTEYSFIVASKSGISYVPFERVDELAAGIGEEGFTTTVSETEGDRLRIYNLKDKTVAGATLNDRVESLCYTGDGRLLIVAGSSMEKKHRLYMCRTRDLSASPLTVNSSDIPEKAEPKVTVPAAKKSEKAKIIENVPVLSQFPDFPTGCESVSAVTVLQFYKEDISAARFIDNYLPKSAEFFYDGFKRQGPSPYEYFIGNPRTAASYGCMAPVIERALCDYFGDSERVKNTTGTELDELCREYIDNGIPVITWATINMLETNPTNSWYLSDGTRFTWPGNEHCLVLIGYDEDNYYFNDPYAGKTVKYEKEKVEDRHAELGRQSVVILKKGE